MSTQAVILIGVAVYMVIMVAVGIYSAKKSHSMADFAVAGRSMPLWLCTITIVATWFGGGMMIGGAGAAYDDGMLGVIADPFGGALCLVLIGLFFVRLIRRLRLYSFVEFIEQRFGRTAGAICGFISASSSLMWVAGMLVAFGVIFETLTGIPLEIGIIGGAVIVIAYTSLGGMLAVALTDFIQMMIIAVGLVMLLVVVLIDVGGWSAIAAQMPEHTFRMLPLEHTLDRWLLYLRMWLIFGLGDICSQSLLQRAMSAKSERVAQQSFYVGAIAYIGFAMIPVLLGIIGSVTMPGLENSESIIPALALEHLHPFAIAVFVGALLAAIMSSCDSAILAAATVISTNLLPLVKRNPSERLRLIVIRAAIPAGGVMAVAGALNAQVVFNTILDANLLILAAVIGPFILGVWWKKANRAGALAGMSAGLGSWIVVATFWPAQPADLIGFGACVVTMLVITPLTQTIDPPRGLVDHEGNEVELDNRLGVLR
jgi:solute:Na+ symporter, SSS family